jgi:hypothetical protein
MKASLHGRESVVSLELNFVVRQMGLKKQFSSSPKRAISSDNSFTGSKNYTENNDLALFGILYPPQQTSIIRRMHVEKRPDFKVKYAIIY